VVVPGGEELSRDDEQESAKAATINASTSISLRLIVFDLDKKNPVAFLRASTKG
jgi:hypothetical protein